MNNEAPNATEAAPKPSKRVYVPPSRRNQVDGSGSTASGFTSGNRGANRPARQFNDENRRNILDGSVPNENSGSYSRRDRFGDRAFGDRGRDAGSYPSPWANRGGRRYIREQEKDVFGEMDTCTHAGINFNSYENIPVQMTGNKANTIIPVEDFETGIHELLMVNIRRVNYTKPTPIQKHSIPVIMAGRDLMACAQTGSGKTAAFLLPICTAMLTSGPPETPAMSSYSHRQAHPVCLVLSPTRELAMQTFTEARKFIFATGIRAVVLYGGSEVRGQLFELDRGCDICVATPGRLTDFIDRNKVGLTCVKYLVLDEADRMLDMGFAPQIRSIVDNSNMPQAGRQTVMFSATFPKEIQQLARDFLTDYLYLAVGRVGSTNEFIRQRLLYADQEQKLRYLIKLLRENANGLVLVFVETKRRADMIEGQLLKDNFMAVTIHGDRSQQDREEALRLFKTGERPILVATDVAARGLDINNITHVINYDLPSNIDDYVHRIGRTGRAGNVGIATSLVNEENRGILRDLLSLLEEANQEVPQWFQKLVTANMYSGGRDYGKRSSGGGKFGRPFASRDMRGHSETVTYNQGNKSRGGGGGGSGGGFSQQSKGSGFREADDEWW
ncbi:ATP-dependent RNA helicase, putative [Babesia caballi]|uniref:RNA helicase n=1 Tax=Babesia caballi TaxID=5871 RepID=A0AAV4LX41_BABCB|nr:ATP-dependent RNA helicase, putative [Babesia caballi]